jgi:hypothetical protein
MTIDVVQAELGDFSAAEAELKGATHDGTCPPHRAAGVVERADLHGDFFVGQLLGQ